MQTYHCVDMLNPTISDDIEASSPDVAMKRFFQKLNISEKPVRSAKQEHKMKYDCRFYTESNHNNDGFRARSVFTGFNREGYEFYGPTDSEFPESLGKGLDWSQCGAISTKKIREI